MGAAATRSVCDVRKDSADSDSSDADSAESSDAGSAEHSGDEHRNREGGNNHGEPPRFVEKVRACLDAKIGFNFTKTESLKGQRSASVPKKAFLITNQGKKLEECFEINWKHQLGEGGYATVCTGKDKRTGVVYAIKCISKAMVSNVALLVKEVDLMLALDHPNIVKLFSTFEDRRSIYLVLELCTGGELFDRIIDQGHFSEPLAATVMEQIFRAVNYMHQSNICHRDLKPENFLFQKKAPIEQNLLKVIDFGIAGTLKPDQPLSFSTKTGTPYYVAPEVVARWPQYGLACDMWSCGVIMYVLLSGRFPFKGNDEAATLAKVMVGKYAFPTDRFGSISEDAKNLIRHLLKKNPEHRLTAEAAVNDPWVRTRAAGASPVPLRALQLDGLRSFRSENRLKKAALHIVARHMDDDAIESLRKTFVELDEDDNGVLTAAEISRGLRKANISEMPEELLAIMNAVDSDGSGQIDYSEFLAATLERKQYAQESALWAAFRVFDTDGDGKISKRELAAILETNKGIKATLSKCLPGRRKRGPPGEEEEDSVQALMRQVDENGDGAIDFDEFMKMMRR